MTTSPAESFLLTLSREHRMISKAAELALNFSALMEAHAISKNEVDSALTTLVEFFLNFCLQIHRPREDSLLFPWLAQFEEQSIQDMLRVLEKDHAYADAILQSLIMCTTTSHDEAAKQLSRYAVYLLQHTSREEDLLFPIVRICAKSRLDFPAITTVKDSDVALAKWEKIFEQLKSSLRV